jgi:hypothetical protein
VQVRVPRVTWWKARTVRRFLVPEVEEVTSTRYMLLAEPYSSGSLLEGLGLDSSIAHLFAVFVATAAASAVHCTWLTRPCQTCHLLRRLPIRWLRRGPGIRRVRTPWEDTPTK